VQLTFYKYHGTGNDFVMIDNRSKSFVPTQSLISSLCDRRFGIGADGLILIENHIDVDFEMIYLNADGSESLCANGCRCAVHFAGFLGMIGNETCFQTISGELKAMIDDKQIRLKMKDEVLPEDHSDFHFLNNGSPHHMEFIEDIEHVNVFERGRKIRYSEQYAPNGANVNFIEIQGKSSLFVRTYERGVENETLSCGTGVIASALAASTKGLVSPISIKTKGGILQVNFEKTNDGQFSNIWLIGPATQVYQGKISI